jgi:C4-dicarboxylate transporter, DctQ subunit
VHPALSRSVAWIRLRAENLCAVLLGVMFIAFLVQIAFRYFFNLPVGWSAELSVVAWMYIVLLGSALWLKEDEQIRFDLLTSKVGPRTKRVVQFLVATAAAVLFAMAMPATAKYVSFMKVESSSYLKIRMDILFSVYLVFAVGLVVRYGWLAWSAWRGYRTDEVDITQKGYGL